MCPGMERLLLERRLYELLQPRPSCCQQVAPLLRTLGQNTAALGFEDLASSPRNTVMDEHRRWLTS